MKIEQDLIARLEAATEGSRELDAEINYTTNLEFLHLRGTIYDIGDLAPHYSTSLDAAITLASPHFAICANGDSKGWQAMDFVGGNIWHEGATPALALTIAALKARNLTCA